MLPIRCCANSRPQVPVELGTLHNLSLLYLGDNKLEQLPAEIGRLGSLRTLNLHNNKFKYLPQVTTPHPLPPSLSLSSGLGLLEVPLAAAATPQ